MEISKAYGKAEWREDLKALMRRTGCDGKRVMFLFSDTQASMEQAARRRNAPSSDCSRLHSEWGCMAGQVPSQAAADLAVIMAMHMQIKEESFIEDINNLLNAGEVPNMFAADEKMQVRWVQRIDGCSCMKAARSHTPTRSHGAGWLISPSGTRPLQPDHGGCAAGSQQGWR